MDSNTFPYNSELALFGSLHPDEWVLIKQISAGIKEYLPENSQLVCPYSYGGHVDHQLTRTAAELLGMPLWYYPDYPYIAELDLTPNKTYSDIEIVRHPISGQGLQFWIKAVAQYESQISTFWPDENAMNASISKYIRSMGGVHLIKLQDS